MAPARTRRDGGAIREDGTLLRIVFSWEYGFKSVESVIKVTFVNKQPQSFWERIPAEAYGVGESVPTRIFNGYGAEDAGLCAGLPSEPPFR